MRDPFVRARTVSARWSRGTFPERGGNRVEGGGGDGNADHGNGVVGVRLNPLVAQNRTYTRYEIRINKPEYDAIAAKGWSEGSNLPDEAHPANLPVGSIAVKAAWQLLTDADTRAARARYYVVKDAEVVDVGKSVAAGRVVCSKSDVALVGLHIMIKTHYRPQWLWSTFEQVDNVPPAGGEPTPDRGGRRKRYYELTGKGQKALAAARSRYRTNFAGLNLMPAGA